MSFFFVFNIPCRFLWVPRRASKTMSSEENNVGQSLCRRQKWLTSMKKKKLGEMRAALPLLTKEDIRKMKMPYHEAVLLQLHDQGYDSSGEYLKQLIDCNEEWRKEFGQDTLYGFTPQLMNSKINLEILANGFKAAEVAYRAGKPDQEFHELMKLATHYVKGSNAWWWIAEQLLYQCVHLGEDNKSNDSGEQEAISRFVSGWFYTHNEVDKKLAKEHLILARKLAKAKKWTVKKYLGQVKRRIHPESCILLCNLLLDEAKFKIYRDSPIAVELCELARKRAIEVCYQEGEAEALKLEGMCHLLTGNLAEAAIIFYRVMKIRTSPHKRENMEKICEARINLAVAYFKTGRSGDAILQLQHSAFAETSNLRFYVAQAHRYLGEYYLTQGETEVATPLLVKALDIFCDIEDFTKAEQTRIFAAISSGVELFPKYAKLLMKMCTPGPEDPRLLRLMLRWKDGREPFWTKSDVSLKSTNSYEEIETECTQTDGDLSIDDPQIIDKSVRSSNTNLQKCEYSATSIGSAGDLLSLMTASDDSVQ